eukprot:9684330-Alexandrium_andersonii.AAC.1
MASPPCCAWCTDARPTTAAVAGCLANRPRGSRPRRAASATSTRLLAPGSLTRRGWSPHRP